LTKEFENRQRKREVEKQEKLEALYESHDKKAHQVTEVMASSGKGDVAVQEASSALMEEMKAERDKLIEHLNKDTDLKEKIIIAGVK